MDIQIVDTPMRLTLSGVGKTHDPNISFGEELIELLNIVWGIVRSRGIPTTGINHAVYGDHGDLFAGVVLTTADPAVDGLSLRVIEIMRYAYFKHIGGYQYLPETHARMVEEIERLGLTRAEPVIEIYGHWNEDETKLVTEIIYPVI